MYCSCLTEGFLWFGGEILKVIKPRYDSIWYLLRGTNFNIGVTHDVLLSVFVCMLYNYFFLKALLKTIRRFTKVYFLSKE